MKRRLTLAWEGVTTADVRRMHMLDAERICAAVIEFAESGTGPVQQV
jgi:hypothetical protein